MDARTSNRPGAISEFEAENKMDDSRKKDSGFVMIRRDSLLSTLTNPEMTDRDRRILLALAATVNSDSHAWEIPLVEIAKLSGVNVNDVSRVTQKLQRMGFLGITRQQRKPNRYTVKGLIRVKRTSQDNLDLCESHSQTGVNHTSPSIVPRITKSITAKTPPSPVTDCLNHFIEIHKHHTGTDYVPQFAADGKQLKDVLKTLDSDEVKARMSRYFIRHDKWNEEHGYTVRNFCSAINNGLAQKSGGARERSGLTIQKEAMAHAADS